MKKLKLLILCIFVLLMAALSSCTTHNTVEPTPMSTPEPQYILDYVHGVTIQRRVP